MFLHNGSQRMISCDAMGLLRNRFALNPDGLCAFYQQGSEPEQCTSSNGNDHHPIAGGVNAEGVWIRIGRAHNNHYDVAGNRKHGEDAYPDTWGKALRRVEELNANPHEDEAWQGM